MAQPIQTESNQRSQLRLWCIRIFLACLMFAILIDTSPSFLAPLVPIRKPVNTILNSMGLGQGDWPLFAPNPVINNGTIVAEIEDKNQHRFQWNSPDWSTKSVWYKFHQFRHMNFYQRLPRYPLACENFADYLDLAIPAHQTVTPITDLTLTSENLPPPDFIKPVHQLKLYYAQFQLVPLDGPIPPLVEDEVWSYQMRLLLQRIGETSSK
jgi:hypothetical protein